MTELSDRIKDLRTKGYSYDKIKEETGASKSTISYWLGAGQKEKTLNRTNNLRREIRAWIVADKESRPCADCGITFKYYQVHYDHLPQYVKSFNIAKFKDYTSRLEIVKAEIAKCDLVCGNCHAERTHVRRLEAKKHKQEINDFLDGITEDDDYWEDDYV